MNQRMPRRLVALSASAITAVYVAGYLLTGAADAGLGASAAAPPTEIATTATVRANPTLAPRLAQPTATGAPARVPTTAPARAPTAAATAAPAAAPAAYRDGTYQGQ